MQAPTQDNGANEVLLIRAINEYRVNSPHELFKELGRLAEEKEYLTKHRGQATEYVHELMRLHRYMEMLLIDIGEEITNLTPRD